MNTGGTSVKQGQVERLRSLQKWKQKLQEVTEEQEKSRHVTNR